MTDFFIFPVVLAITIFLFYHFRILYQRNFKAYKSEVIDYLSDNGLELIAISKPENRDYKFCPFPEPQREDDARITFMSLNGFPIFRTDEKYLIIKARDASHKTRTIWTKIYTIYFKKPTLEFRAQKNEL